MDMDTGLILGIDLCDDYSQVYSYTPGQAEVHTESEDTFERIPTVVCKKKGVDEWLIGEEAYRVALFGGGTMVDRLIKLVRKDGSATIEGVRYSAEQLLEHFLQKLLELVGKKDDSTEVSGLVLAVHELEGRLNDALIRVTERCGIDRTNVHIFSHTESYIYYVLSQPKEFWNNQTSLFDLREDGLYYYELRLIRGRKPPVVEATHEKLPEGFSLEVLDTPSGEHLADSILTACAERLLNRKILSTVFLTGKGFMSTDWAPSFIRLICKKSRVFAGPQLFAQGAAYAAKLYCEHVPFPFLCVCEGRISSTVSLYAVHGGKREQIILAQAGENWYEAKTRAEFILDDVKTLELSAAPVGSARVETISIPLDELPVRPNKTTRIEVVISFTSETNMTVRILDKGFGELFPASDVVLRQDYLLP